MNDLEFSNRQLLPRWIPFDDVNILTPFTEWPVKNMNEEEKKNFFELQNSWYKKNTVPQAVEIIAISHLFDIADTPSYFDSVSYLMNKHSDVIDNNIFLQNFLKKHTNQISFQDRIRNLKQISRNFYSDPSIWTDLAYYYSCLGQIKQAEKASYFALRMNPNDIFSIRSLVKYYLLRNNIDAALWLLYKNDDLKNNPLCISTEISICQAYGINSKLLRKGSSITKNLIIHKPNENELFATMGTLEFNSGNSKKGMKLLSNSLKFPNENIIAQVRYITNRYNKPIDLSKFNTPCRFEADSWIAYKNSDFEKLLEQTEKWFYFQPFTPQPAIMNSYINSLIFNDEEKSIKMTSDALKISKNNFSLQNNLVVSLYRDNQLEEANKQMNILKKIPLEKDESFVLLATEGLSDIHNGNIEIGNKFYQQALDGFTKNNDFEKKSRLLYYWAWECRKLHDNKWVDLIKESKEIASKHNLIDLYTAINKNFKELN